MFATIHTTFLAAVNLLYKPIQNLQERPKEQRMMVCIFKEQVCLHSVLNDTFVRFFQCYKILNH